MFTSSRYILPIFLVILSGLLYIVYIEGAYANIHTSIARSAELDKTIASSKEVQQAQDELYATLAEIRPIDKARLEKIYPKTVDPVRLLYDLNTIATRHSLVVKSPNVSQIEEPNAAPGIPKVTTIKFSVTGPYFVFKEFLGDLEKSIVLIDVTGVTITGAGEETAQESQPLMYTIDARVYSSQ